MTSAAEAPRSWSRLDGVDLLRGLAILFVLMNHVNMRLLSADVTYTRGLPEQLVSSLVWNGQRGVQIFFAVSGFLITSTTLRRWQSLPRVSVRAFYQMRFARIAPLLVALLGILSVLHFAGVRHFTVSPKTGGLGRALIAALTFHVNVLEAHRGYLPGNWDILWSLSVEEMFYIFFPLTCRLLRRGKLFIALLLAFVMLGPFGRTVFTHGNEVWREYSYLGGMDAISLGCLYRDFDGEAASGPFRSGDPGGCGRKHCRVQPLLLAPGRRLGPRPQRARYDCSGGGDVHAHRGGGADPVEESAASEAAAHAGPAQLRGLSHSHVRGFRGVSAVRCHG